MKPEEAILMMRNRIDTASEIAGKGTDGKAFEDMEMAISALKKIQQYQEIGSVEECKELASMVTQEKKNALGKIVDEWNEYIEIGTVEECREAVEKQKAKKPLGGADINGNEYMIYRECSAIVEDGEWRAMYCPDCGQAIQWDEKLEE